MPSPFERSKQPQSHMSTAEVCKKIMALAGLLLVFMDRGRVSAAVTKRAIIPDWTSVFIRQKPPTKKQSSKKASDLPSLSTDKKQPKISGRNRDMSADIKSMFPMVEINSA